VPVPNEEAGRVRAHVLVFVERNLDPLRAVGVAALAEELRVLGLEALRRLRDSLVNGAEEGLVARDLRPSGGHVAENEQTERTVAAGTLPPVATKEWPEAVERVSSYLREAGRGVRLGGVPGSHPQPE